MKDKIKQIKERALAELSKIKKLPDLDDLSTKFLGRKGELTSELRKIVNLTGEEKKLIGQLGNTVKKEISASIEELKEKLLDRESTDQVDVTLPGKKIEAGHTHPITRIMDELEDLFLSMGFMVLDGPEVESDFYNFEALNIPPFHPSRDIQDTFYISSDEKNDKKSANEPSSDLLMRTHTSPVQIRAMRKYGAPLRCVVPGRVFRCEATDACHDSTFYQLEGLMIGKDIAITHLISVLKEMLSGIFKEEVEIRVRPGYFPFVEPGLEIDVRCTICGGKGCSSCKNEGWLEMLGSGMIHPKVLEYGGIDPKIYSGFAFGMGVDRLAMMHYGINDIRLFHSGDLRFLNQF